MRIPRAVAVAAVTLVAIAGCGGNTTSDDTETGADGGGAGAGAPSGAPDETAPPGSGRGAATLELANGESFRFDGLLCALDPQQSVGSEILFSAVAYGDPGLDATQFGDEGTVTGIASITVYDGDFNTLWDAQSMFEPFGGSIELSLDGTTITGTGTFFAGGDPQTEPVAGTLVADC